MSLTHWFRRWFQPWRVHRAHPPLARRYISLGLRRLESRRVFNVTSVNLGSDLTINEGTIYNLAATYVDHSSGNTPHTATADWGDGYPASSDGNGLTIAEPSGAADQGSVTGSHRYADNGVFTVTLIVDGPSNHSDQDTLVVTVNNVAPTAQAGGPYIAPIGGSVQLNGSATDPGGVNDPLTFTWDLDNDGTFGETGANAARGDETGQTPTFDATGLSPGTVSTIHLRVSDDDGGITNVSTTVTVNQPPTIAALSNQAVNQSQALGPITLTVSDAETPLASLSFSATSTNPTLLPVANIVFDNSGAQPTVTVTPTTGEWGTTDITLTVTDADGASAQRTFTLLVNDAPTLTTASFALSATDENTPTAVTTVSNLLTAAGYADVNTASPSGMAITATSGHGTWQYSTNAGTTWQALPAVANNSAFLLAASVVVRYVPDDRNGESASLTFRGWDQTTGTALNSADTSTSGGTTAFSSTTSTANLTINAVNDAPTIAGGPVTLATITEDASPYQITIAALLANFTVTDVDTGATSGIALTASSGNQPWQYSLDNGNTWVDVGAVTDSAALLLATTNRLRYTPDGHNGETASLTFRAWDQTSANAGDRVDTAAAGGATAFSTAAVQASVAITNLNDAPTLVGGTHTLGGTNEDTTSAVVTVAALLTSAGYADVDAGAATGIAVIASTGTGHWQYFNTVSTTWVDVGSVSGSASLLLDSAAQLRYQPNMSNGETATLTFRAWDQTTGTLFGSADTTTSGGTTAFSANTGQASLTVTSVNDAPTLSGGPVTLTTISEDAAAYQVTVANVLAQFTVNDVDSGAASGVAITALVGNGSWQYSLDSGTTWLAIGPVTSTAVLLLNSTDLMRYTPDAMNGETASFTFRAWDQTTNQHGDRVDTTTNGGTTPFSTSTGQANITVTSVNDAPVLTGGTYTIATTDENTPSTHVIVSTLLTTAGYSDVDSGATAGIAVTSVSGAGNWQYSIDNGLTWHSLTAPTASAAFLLAPTSWLRFQPDGQNGCTATLTFRAWDQTTGTALGTLNTTSFTSTAAFSANTGQATLTVTSVNDAPTLSGGPVTLTSMSEDAAAYQITVASVLAQFTVSDVDGGAASGVAITGLVGNSSWQYSLDSGTTWLAIGPVTSTAALLLNSTDLMRYTPDAMNGETASFKFRAWDQTTNQHGDRVDTTTNGGTTAFSTSTGQANITVTSVNDAPVLTGGTYTIATTDENTPSTHVIVSTLLTTVGYSDVDSGATAGIAVTSVSGAGNWQYSIDNGSTWHAITAPTASAAFLLAPTSWLRFRPDGQNGSTASLTFRAWDQTSGSPLGTLNTTSFTSTAAYSANTGQATLTVTSVNDAPTLSGGPVALTSTNEDSPSSSTSIGTILSGVSLADVDSGALTGIAVTALVGQGTWESTLDGTNWFAIGPVSTASSLLLANTALVRYLPDGLNGETASFTFRGWDQTSDHNGDRVDTSANGGVTAFSTNTAQARLIVTSVNDDPVLTGGTYAITATDENTASTSTTVAALLASAGYSDVDSGAVSGVAITASTGHGTWQYSTNSGTTWSNLPAVSGNAAFLLSSTTLVRYQPDLQNGETATLTFRAWDQTTGTALGTLNTTTFTSTAAFSANTGQATINVTSVNDAPTLSGGPVVLSATNENTTSAEITVATLLASLTVGDVDSGAVTGIAITATSGLGGWEYSIDSGASWHNVGAVTTAGALLLADDARLGYQPNGLNGETASFTFRAWDRTAGTSGSTANTTTTGNATPFSTATATATLSVSSVNDAPQINPASHVLTATNEDTASSTTLVSTILAGVGLTDVDTGAASGIAVTSTVGTGSWQFFNTTTSSWQSFGAVSDSASLLLTSGTQVRYQPDLQRGETASFTFRAWDQTSGAALSKVDSSITGGSTAFSVNTAQATISVTNVNDAPTLAGGPVVLPATDENTPSAVITVSSLLTGVTVNDVDAAALTGIAITARTGNGVWRYSLDNGGTWNAINSVSTATALLLSDSAWLMYTPDGLNGETASLTFRAWDQSSGTSGSTANTTTSGGTTPFSTGTAQATLAVASVNDAPTLVGGTFTFTTINEDAISSSVAISTMLTTWGRGDVDTGAASGVAIIGATGNGLWQYSTGGGVWNNITAVSPTQSLLLTASTLVRYQGDTHNGELATLTVRAWDQSSGTATTLVNTTTFGGSTAFSTNTAVAQITTTSVNDAPIVSGGPAVLIGTNEDTLSPPQTVASILANVTYSDIDTGAASGMALVATTGNGVWQYSLDGGVNWSAVGSVNVGSSLLLDPAALLRYQPDTLNGEVATLAFRGWDQSAGTVGSRVSTATNGGVQPYSSSIVQGVLNVTHLNDLPTISALAGQLIQINQTLAPQSFTIGDVDLGDVLTVTAQSSNPALVAAGNITLGGSGLNRTIAITPQSGQTGTTIITLTVTDAAGGTGTSAFTLRVNAPPQITPLADQLFQASNVPQTLGPMPIVLHDADPLDVLSVTVTSSDPTLLPQSGLALSGSGLNRSLSLTPITGHAGTSTITVTVTDGFGGVATDTFHVRFNAAPTNAVPGNQLTQRDVPLGPLTFTVNDVDPGDTLTVTAASSVPSLVPNGNVTITGSGHARTITILPGLNQSGDATVTLTVNDGHGGSASGQFQLRVNAPPVLPGLAASVINVDSTTTLTSQIVDDRPGPVQVTIIWGDTATNDTLTVANPAVFAIEHTYLSPPDPSNPAAPVSIRVIATDGEGGVTNEVVIAHVSGNGIPIPILRSLNDLNEVPTVRNVDLPARIESVAQPIATNTLTTERTVVTEQVESTRRQVLLRLVTATGDEQSEAYVLPEVVMQDLPALLKRLPDGRYRLYLVEDAITPPRLMIDVYVQRGRAVSPADMQADRTPTPSAREQSQVIERLPPIVPAEPRS